MKRQIRMWIIRSFGIVITETEAEKLNLKWDYNVHRDAINVLNYRSVWRDKYFRFYPIKSPKSFELTITKFK